ncbi:MAG: ABC transporter substrate-binding protein, partial [Deltaproteobacteria bacterium]|nr:ABC transporter substrate-binding protein [Deltaproteobacteria bacterium]
MKRREFITLLGGAAAWPFTARAQQVASVRRIGVLMSYSENDAEAKAYLSGFTQGLQELGWTDGRNARIDVRWAAGSGDRMRVFAKELVDLQPHVILSNTTPVTAALQRATQTIPIVFVVVSDPVGDGFVASLAHPGRNLTGFIYTEAEMGGKWLELLKEIAPGIKRAAIMFNPDTAPGQGSYYLPSFEAAARSLQVEPITAPVHSEVEIEAGIVSLGREPGGGLIAMGDSFMWGRRSSAILAAARNNVPAIYPGAVCARDGGLLSYSPDIGDIFRRATPYVDRILRGANPASLPVQNPVKFELVINLKTAKALGLDVPFQFQQRADEVIE